MATNPETDERKLSEATSMYRTLCTTLDNMKWHYEKDEENLIVRTSAVGDDLTMKLFMKIDASRSVMYLKSGMPFEVPQNRIDEMGKAVLIANWAMLNGSFEMDRKDGYIAFKIVVPFMGSTISEEACHYIINLSCRMIDLFNDKFLALSKGEMTLTEFEQFTEKDFK